MRNPLVPAAAVILLTLPASGLAATWTVPGTVNAAGLNNTRFVSDVAVTNPGALPASVTLSFIGPGGLPPRTINVPAGSTTAYRNVLDALWSAQGAGATQVTSATPLLIRARTYNTAASGTYGVALPVFADDRILPRGRSAHSLWVSQSADANAGYRTNVAVVFPDAGGGAATVTVYGADGAALGAQAFSLDAPGFQQFGVGAFAGAVSVARARVEVTRGRAAGYSVVVDNVTGDSSLFTFEELPSGYQDVVVNGVARANGRNDTFFRTDGRFFNPTEEDAVVTASFHASGPSNPAPVSGTFTVGAGRVLDVTDLLGSLLQLPVGSAGALRFETEAPVAILCRTSNVDPLGVKPGTYGAQQKPTPLLSFLMSADAGAVVTGLRQNGSFRTNVGFAAGADGASWGLTLKSATGAVVATASGSLGAFGWTQPNAQDLFPAVAIPDDATLLVKVTAGSVDVFDSSIDNTSGDPVVTPIMPLPADVPASATVGPQGGSVRSADGRLTLKIPAGALASPVALSLAPQEEPGALGSAYALTPAVLQFAKPALLVFRPGDATPLLGLLSVSLAIRSEAGTFAAVGGRIDAAAGTLSVPITTTSPSAASGGSSPPREPQAIGGVILPLANAVLFPAHPVCLTSGSVDVSVRLEWPASAGEQGPGFKLLLSDQDRKALSIRWSKPTAGQLIPYLVDPARAGYLPGNTSAADSFRDFTVSLRGTRAHVILFGTIEVVRRNWIIETDFTLRHIPCETGIFNYELDWQNFQRGTFRINDGGSLTLTGSQYQYETPVWKLCPPPAIGNPATYYKVLTPDPNEDFDLEVVLSAFSSFDSGQGMFTLEGTSNYASPGATLTGGSFPYEDERVDPVRFPLPISLKIRLDQEGLWFDDDSGSFEPYFHTRHRIISVD